MLQAVEDAIKHTPAPAATAAAAAGGSAKSTNSVGSYSAVVPGTLTVTIEGDDNMRCCAPGPFCTCTQTDNGYYVCSALHTGKYLLADGKYNGRPFWRRALSQGEPIEDLNWYGEKVKRSMRLVCRDDGGEWGFIFDGPELTGNSYLGDDCIYVGSVDGQLPHQIDWSTTNSGVSMNIAPSAAPAVASGSSAEAKEEKAAAEQAAASAKAAILEKKQAVAAKAAALDAAASPLAGWAVNYSDEHQKIFYAHPQHAAVWMHAEMVQAVEQAQAAAAAAAAAQAQAEMVQLVAQMTAMGFSAEQAEVALVSTGQNVAAAIDLLVAQQQHQAAIAGAAKKKKAAEEQAAASAKATAKKKKAGGGLVLPSLLSSSLATVDTTVSDHHHLTPPPLPCILQSILGHSIFVPLPSCVAAAVGNTTVGAAAVDNVSLFALSVCGGVSCSLAGSLARDGLR